MKSTHSEIRVVLLEIHKNTHALTYEGEGEEWSDGKQSRCRRSVDV